MDGCRGRGDANKDSAPTNHHGNCTVWITGKDRSEGLSLRRTGKQFHDSHVACHLVVQLVGCCMGTGGFG